ncbi:hypothetical protein AB0C42_33955 [Micromonospora taraxaci]|uniref:hypothetical protein n=1 Tax=Micromonospora TaxID=1873 RepID=UPI0033AB8CAD
MNTDAIMVNATIQQIRQHYPHLGLQVPDGMADAIAQIDAESDQPQYTVDPGELRAAVATAHEAGEDPATDEAVRTALARYQLASLNLGPTPASRAERRAAVLHTHMDAILTDLTWVVDQGDAVLTRVREAGVNPNEPFMAGNATRVALWEEAQEALNRITHAGKLWGLLVAAFRLVERPQARRALILADLTPEQLFAIDGRDLLAAARAGHPLKLATPEGFKQRSKRVDEHLAAEAARLERERNGQRGKAAA